MSTRRRFLGLLAAAPVAASMPRMEPAAEVIEPVIMPPSGGARIEWAANGYRVYDENGTLRIDWSWG